jgi:xanthine/CO dehydrogenase XdhC/CoxF family maturation factor
VKQWLETRQVFDALAAWHAAGVPCALATVVRVRGSAYRHEGAKLVVTADGRSVGNVSGGCLEEDVRAVGERVIRTGVAERRKYCGSANEIEAWDLGVGCEGEVEIFVEPVLDGRVTERAAMAREEAFAVRISLDSGHREIVTDAEFGVLRGAPSHLLADDATFVDVFRPPPRLLIVSAGDDARHVAALADGVGFRVVVADRRPGLLAPDRFAPSVRLVESDAARLAERVVLDADDAAVVMTHHFADDTDYVRTLLKSPVRYIGILGPRARTERLLGLLRAEGPIDESRIFAPIGLDIGTDGAEQVALAVVAELLAVRSGRSPRSLRERRAPIHTSEPTAAEP